MHLLVVTKEQRNPDKCHVCTCSLAQRVFTPSLELPAHDEVAGVLLPPDEEERKVVDVLRGHSELGARALQDLLRLQDAPPAHSHLLVVHQVHVQGHLGVLGVGGGGVASSEVVAPGLLLRGKQEAVEGH